MKGSGLIVLVLAGCGLMIASSVEAAPGYEFGVTNQRDFRSRRGFKTVGLATARGFGKRTVLPPFSAISSPVSQSYTYEAGEQRQEQTSADEHPGNDDLETYAPLIHLLHATLAVEIFMLPRLHPLLASESSILHVLKPYLCGRSNFLDPSVPCSLRSLLLTLIIFSYAHSE